MSLGTLTHLLNKNKYLLFHLQWTHLISLEFQDTRKALKMDLKLKNLSHSSNSRNRDRCRQLISIHRVLKISMHMEVVQQLQIFSTSRSEAVWLVSRGLALVNQRVAPFSKTLVQVAQWQVTHHQLQWPTWISSSEMSAAQVSRSQRTKRLTRSLSAGSKGSTQKISWSTMI